MRPNSLILIKNQGRILAQKGLDKKTNQVFYRLIGGGIENGEFSRDALRREVKEELGAIVRIEKLLDVIENIFMYEGIQKHEITFLYSGEFKKKSFYEEKFLRILDKANTTAEWISSGDVKKGKITLYPKEARKFI